MRIFLLLIIMSTLQSCEQPNKNSKTSIYEKYRTQQIDLRDSLFVLHTVKEWARLNWWTWGVREDMYHITQNEIEYFIEGAFYNPDKTKILVWVGEKKPNANAIKNYNEDSEMEKICPIAKDTIYSLSALIGIRNDMNQIWKLYPFNQQQAICCKNKEEAINILGQYYFEKMKYHKMYRVLQKGNRKGYLELEEYKYNLQDIGFWTNCWLWQKDTVVSYGLYPFEICRYACDKEDYNRIIETYPDQKQNETNGEYVARHGQIICIPLRKKLKDCAEPYNLPKVEYPIEILKLYK